MKSEVQRLNNAISKAILGFRPPEKLTVSEWSDKNRRLSQESSAEVGRWRTTRTPYLKDIMDAFCDPKTRHIVFVASSQVGKSEAMNNMIGYAIDQDPGSILFIQPTTVDAKDYSKLRMAPMIRDTPCLRAKVSDPKSRDSGNTILQKTYPGGILTLCGSTEAHALASKPIRYVFGDERDRWAASAGTEGDPWGLATARQITFYNAKSVEVSTPTIKGASTIEKSYKKGTMERWETMCPDCKEFSEVVFDNIRFEKTEIVIGREKTYEVKNIYYICPKCGAIHTEAEIKKQPSKWVATNPDALRLHKTRSFWLSSWMSPWTSWENTIIEYLLALGDAKKLQVVFNTRFGQLWEDRGDLEDENSVMARREDYGQNEDGTPVELPEGVLVLTCGVDTQDDRLEYEIVGYGHFGATWGIKKGVIMGRPDTDNVWGALDDIIGHVYRFKNGPGLRVSITFVDEGGHFTMEVRQRCKARYARKVFAIKGRGGEGIPYISPPKKQKILQNNRQIGTCEIFEIGVDEGKAAIMSNLQVQSPEAAKYCHFPKRDDYGSAYFASLLSEKLTYKPSSKNKWQWEKIPGHERNEALDCRNYANAACKLISPNYDAIERRLNDVRQNGAPRPAPTQPHNTSNTPTAHKKIRGSDFYNDW